MSAAKQPDCPCWNQDKSLLAIVTELIAEEGDVVSCDQNPAELSHRRRISQSAAIIGEAYQIEASQVLGGGPNERTCTIFIGDRGIIQPLKKNQFWRCAEDITRLCRELFESPPEE